jgi:hypothetical protein
VRRLVPLLSVLALLLPVPAYADSFGTYVTKVAGITPALPGVTVRSPANGEEITVTNTSSTPLIVEGYQQDPYLKVTKDGVWENKLSPAVALNKLSVIEVPKGSSATAAPVWVKLNSTNHAQWHDHRIHWMGTVNPPMVQKDPGKPHLIKDWTIPIHFGDTTASITGTLTYKPGSHTGTYLTYGAIGAAVLIIIGLQVAILRRRRNGGSDGGSDGDGNGASGDTAASVVTEE